MKIDYPFHVARRNFQADLLPHPGPECPPWPGSKPLLDLEIGCGVGLHPIQYCQQNPNRFLMAIEHTKTKFNSFQGRVNNHQLTNLLPIHANGISWVAHYVPEKSLDRIFLLYPNPNPKNRALRWHAMPFMGFLLDRLKNNGQLMIATNEVFYAEECTAFMREVWDLNCNSQTITPLHFSPRTHFEKKYLERGQICYDLLFTKKEK